jgi:hypothetical protein
MTEFKKDDRVQFEDWRSEGTVQKVIGELITVCWDDVVYPYKNPDYEQEVNEDAYLARQLTLVRKDEKR